MEMDMSVDTQLPKSGTAVNFADDAMAMSVDTQHPDSGVAVDLADDAMETSVDTQHTPAVINYWDNLSLAIRSQIIDLATPPCDVQAAAYHPDGSIEVDALRPYFHRHGAVFQVDRGTRQMALDSFFASQNVRVKLSAGLPIQIEPAALSFGLWHMQTCVIDVQVEDYWHLSLYVPLLGLMHNLRHLKINAMTGRSKGRFPRTNWDDVDNTAEGNAFGLHLLFRSLASIEIAFPQATSAQPYDKLIADFMAQAYINAASPEKDGFLGFLVKRAIRRAQTKTTFKWPLCGGYFRHFSNDPLF